MSLKNIPQKIYLQIGDDGRENADDFNDLLDVTWCADKTDGSDIEYKRTTCDHSCGPSDYYKGGKCDINGCYEAHPPPAYNDVDELAKQHYPDGEYAFVIKRAAFKAGYLAKPLANHE